MSHRMRKARSLLSFTPTRLRSKLPDLGDAFKDGSLPPEPGADDQGMEAVEPGLDGGERALHVVHARVWRHGSIGHLGHWQTGMHNELRRVGLYHCSRVCATKNVRDVRSNLRKPMRVLVRYAAFVNTFIIYDSLPNRPSRLNMLQRRGHPCTLASRQLLQFCPPDPCATHLQREGNS